MLQVLLVVLVEVVVVEEVVVVVVEVIQWLDELHQADLKWISGPRLVWLV